MNTRTKMLTSTAMLCAIAYIAVAACRIPVVLFLKYDPKDVIITLGGLIWGPMTSCLLSVIVSLIEMLTISAVSYTHLLDVYKRQSIPVPPINNSANSIPYL